MSPWTRLRAAIEHVIVDRNGGESLPKLFECDHEEDGAFSALAGLRAARAAVLDAADARSPLPAVLVVGISARRTVTSFEIEGEGAAFATLLEWPGAAYLQYGFSAETLCAAAAAVVGGAKSPLPSGMHVTRGDLLRSSSNIRHWLEGRLRNEGGALEDFYAETRGEMQLVREHLEPRASISNEHQEMLDRLFGFEAPSRRYVPSASGFDGIRHAIDEFEAAWKSLEVSRATYLAQFACADSAQRMKLAGRVCIELERVADALKRAIAATKCFDEQIKQIPGDSNGD